MRDYKTVMRFSRIAWMEVLRSMTFWFTLGIVFLVILYLCGTIGESIRSYGERMNLFELYIWFLTARFSRIIYLAGMLILLCGITFFHKGASYYLLRVNRKIWVSSQIVFLIAVVVFYNVIILCALWCGCRGLISFQGEWSTTAFMACQFGEAEVGLGMAFVAYPNLLAYNPNYLGLITLILSILNSLWVGLVMLVFQSKGKVIYGIIVVIGLWYAEIMMLVENFTHPILPYLTPFRLSMISLIGIGGAGPSVLYAIVYHILFLFALGILLNRLSKQVDFLKME